jgi:hypothetical protein
MNHNPALNQEGNCVIRKQKAAMLKHTPYYVCRGLKQGRFVSRTTYLETVPSFFSMNKFRSH